MTANDIVGISLSLAVAALAFGALVTTFYCGIKALAETAVDVWRWLKPQLEARRRDREEMLEEWARRVAR